MTFRTAVMVAASFVIAAVPVTVPAAAARPVDGVQVPFHVDSGDPCPRGYTEGVLVWHPDTDVIDVVGDVVDPVDPSDPACVDDGMYTVASFTVYDLGIPEVSTKKQVDNGDLTFAMPVDGNTTESQLDPLTIQVCRVSPQPQKNYCGKAQQFKPPL
jgi:hypothetical protein